MMNNKKTINVINCNFSLLKLILLYVSMKYKKQIIGHLWDIKSNKKLLKFSPGFVKLDKKKIINKFVRFP